MAEKTYTNRDVDLTINKGGEFNRKVTLLGVDLTGVTALRATIMQFPDARYCAEIPLEASIVDAPKLIVALHMATAMTSTLNFRNQKYYWSLYIARPNDEWERVLGGRAILIT